MSHIDFLHELRRAELESAIQFFPDPKRIPRPKVLEIGAGTGYQSAILADLGYDVTAVDIDSSAYKNKRVFPVTDYDGKSLPLESDRFDVVFSSNVLEHVRDIGPFLDETRRVLTSGGRAIHILPTPTWRCWSALTHYAWLTKRTGAFFLKRKERADGDTFSAPKVPNTLRGLIGTFVPLRHGERGMTLTEPYFYRKRWWTCQFEKNAYEVVETRPTGIFYTENLVFGSRMPLSRRQNLAHALGSACCVYVLAKAFAPAAQQSRNN